MAAISTPTTAKNAILSLFIFISPYSESKERDVEFRPAVEALHALLMISPTPGIRRPSYNGAPAMPTSAHFQTAKVIILRVPCSSAPLNSLNDLPPLDVSSPPTPQRVRARFPAPLKTLDHSDV
jgi:hypothetical protein